MKQTFPTALSKVLVYEGGYVNNPRDPGGATNKGITQSTYNAWRKTIGHPIQSVRKITSDEVAAIYKNSYWAAIKGDNLPVGIDMALFDFAVNSGVSRAIKTIQHLVGVTADGKMGPHTLKAIADHQFMLTDKLCDARLRFLQSLHTWSTFGKGWSSRVAKVRATAKTMRKVYAQSVHH